MPSNEFRDAVIELYQGEILGEVLFEDMLAFYDEPSHAHKIASLLQLETETKARLRPLVLSLGIDPAELEASRQDGHKFAENLKGLDWETAMSKLHDGVKPYAERYREIVDIAPREHKAVAASMVSHEKALLRFTELEAAGDTERSLDDVNTQLHWPLPAPN